ncbi:multiubiquitin domain-containing protein [bacterium]|nr:multiubiquitin domain-containing protein [bacterium]
MSNENTGDALREEIRDEIADLEEYSKRGERPPLCRGYRIRVNGDRFVVHSPHITGREVLTLAGFRPPTNYTIRVKIRGERPRKIELDETVDLRTPGVEKFRVLPKDQTNG